MNRRRKQNSTPPYRNAKSDNMDREPLMTDCDYPDSSQFEEPQPQPARLQLKPILFILAFLVFGLISLTFGILITTGYFENQYQDRAWPLLIIGILMFIPGGYYGYIIVNILCRREGFAFDDIPIY